MRTVLQVITALLTFADDALGAGTFTVLASCVSFSVYVCECVLVCVVTPVTIVSKVGRSKTDAKEPLKLVGSNLLLEAN